MDESLAKLISAAKAAQISAYAPYSGYKVGAAILGGDGRIHTGCNVENVSFGLSICAERSACFRMAGEGCRSIVAVAVATRDAGTPCGACLQVLSEFVDDAQATCVVCAGDTGDPREFAFADLLPHGFRASGLSKA